MKPSDLSELKANATGMAHRLKIMSHPERLMMLCRLDEGEASVTELVDLAGLSQSAVSICNFARFDDPARIGSTKGTGTRFFETLASGALIAGDLPTDDMFTAEFGGVEGIASLPLACSHLDTDVIAELVAQGRNPRVRRCNRAHALASQDLAHRMRQILGHIGVAEPPLLTERFEALEAQRAELLSSV